MEQIVKLKAIIVGVCSIKEEEFYYQIEELKGLAEACNFECISQIVQMLDHPNNSTYFGSGKILEIAETAKLLNADAIIFNDELSPAVLSNISDIVDCEIIDRTMLILEIFKKRAQTKEASLQVELANLKYMLPRLVGKNKNMSRIGGTSGSGATRGTGETQLELDRRIIENKINKIESDLKDVVKARQTTRLLRKKSNTPCVALAGYTNAGKSSTINSLMKYSIDVQDKEVFVKDMLFATLETSTRRIKLKNNHEFLLTDTVGFVQKLPHHLIEAFKSTLEEVQESSLILHIIDASSPHVEQEIITTNTVLKELGCSNIPVLYCFNKMDRVKNSIFIPTNYSPSLYISNITNEGLDDLIKYIDENVFTSSHNVLLNLPYERGDIYNLLKEKANVESTEYTDTGMLVKVTLSEHLFNLYKEYIKEE